jgi:hypothetical protein
LTASRLSIPRRPTFISTAEATSNRAFRRFISAELQLRLRVSTVSSQPPKRRRLDDFERFVSAAGTASTLRRAVAALSCSRSVQKSHCRNSFKSAPYVCNLSCARGLCLSRGSDVSKCYMLTKFTVCWVHRVEVHQICFQTGLHSIHQPSPNTKASGSSFAGVSPPQSSFVFKPTRVLSESSSTYRGVSSLFAISKAASTHCGGSHASATFRPQAFPTSRRFAPLLPSRACFIPQTTYRVRSFEGFSLHTATLPHREELPPCRCRMSPSKSEDPCQVQPASTARLYSV